MENDYALRLMAGVDIPIQELQLVVHSPTIAEIARMGEQQFFMASQYLCLEKESLIQDKVLLSSLTNFQVLMKVLEQSKDKDKKIAIINLLSLLFPTYVPMITKNSIILSSQEEGQSPILIDNNNFDIFQAVIKEVLCLHSIFQGGNIVYNPGNDRAREIAEKLNKARQKIQAQKGNSNESALTRYVSILSVGQVATLNECLGYNLFQLFDLMERYNSYVEWDTDLKIRLAGGTPDKSPESWMRDLHGTNQVQIPAGAGSDQIKVYK